MGEDLSPPPSQRLDEAAQLALGLYALFGVVAFGWRTWLQRRRTGDTGLRIQAAPWTVQWWAKDGFVLALVAGVAAPVAGLLGMEQLRFLDRVSLRVAGAGVVVVGIAATAAA